LKRYRAEDLRLMVAAMAGKLGLEAPMARAMAARVVDAELLGHRTHGLLFFPAYLERLEKGHIAKGGKHEVLSDTGSVFAWKANRLAGAWMMQLATEELLSRAAKHGVASASIANCSHIGCLQAYLLPFTERGLMVQVAATNPGIFSVAPFGGIDPVLTTNPIAFGIPTSGTPILSDMSTSVASNALFNGYAARDEQLPGQWLLDAEGNPTSDPKALNAKPPGTILPLGGLDFGYKGFGLGLFVEALALALPGYGRAQKPDMFGQGVYVQAIDPAVFSGREHFLKEVDNLVALCKQSRPRKGTDGVRVPGERALRSMKEQNSNGVQVGAGAIQKLEPWLKKTGVNFPEEIAK
jgi:LDH2 family malate/lactate/ureidoglycolate dehydrogenase